MACYWIVPSHYLDQCCFLGKSHRESPKTHYSQQAIYQFISYMLFWGLNTEKTMKTPIDWSPHPCLWWISLLWYSDVTQIHNLMSFWLIVFRTFVSGSCASSCHCQVDKHLIIKSNSWCFHWLACKKLLFQCNNLSHPMRFYLTNNLTLVCSIRVADYVGQLTRSLLEITFRLH